MEHSPCAWIYSRKANRIDFHGTANYFDNLELLDVTITALRQAMMDAAVWDSTTVIATSDHPFRKSYWETESGWTEEEAILTKRRPETFDTIAE